MDRPDPAPDPDSGGELARLRAETVALRRALAAAEARLAELEAHVAAAARYVEGLEFVMDSYRVSLPRLCA